MLKINKNNRFSYRSKKPTLKDILPYHAINFEEKLLKNKYYCDQCHGSTWMIHPDEVSDPIEGWKCAARVRCTRCNLTGLLPISYYKEKLKTKIEEWRIRGEERKKSLKKLKEIAKKYTQEQLEEIKWFINNNYPY